MALDPPWCLQKFEAEVKVEIQMSLCFIEATSSFNSVALPELFIRSIKDEEARRKVGWWQRGVWARNGALQ